MANFVSPANTRRWSNVGLLMGHRPRRWPNNEPTLDQRLVCSHTMLAYCWTTVYDAGAAVIQHWMNAWCFAVLVISTKCLYVQICRLRNGQVKEEWSHILFRVWYLLSPCFCHSTLQSPVASVENYSDTPHLGVHDVHNVHNNIIHNIFLLRHIS